MNDSKAIEDTLDRVEELSEQFKQSFGEQFDGQPYALNALSDDEHAAWFESWVKKYPPEAFTTKDGEIVIGSAWVLMLEHTENGMEEITRYNTTRMNQELARYNEMAFQAFAPPVEQGVY